MDSELLELVTPAVDDGYTELAYGRHSIYRFDRPMTDVRDVLLDHYEGRHRPARLIESHQWPVYVDELIYGVMW